MSGTVLHLEASHIPFPKWDTDYVEAASQFQTMPRMHSEVLAVLQASLAYGSKGILYIFLFHSLLTVH